MELEQAQQKLEQMIREERTESIIEEREYHADGYVNLLNKYGTKIDNSTAYQYQAEPLADDMELVRQYEGNGLFTKIIDRPAEEAIKHGLDIDFGNEDISAYVEDKLDDIGFEDAFATAEKWARLYGGAIIVMFINDGRGLDEPLDVKRIKSVEELRVFERTIVTPDWTSMYNFNPDLYEYGNAYGEPEYFQVSSTYGYFRVHRTRCLVFRNGRVPEQTTNNNYRYWGIPEFVKIKKALRECVTTHENGTKLLERCVQAIYKMNNLANLLTTEEGENKVLQRLQLIDMARNIINSIAIDGEGEDYDFKSFSLTGVKEIVETTCSMLSAVTNIPQTILFGASPTGMDSTGRSDLENYYNMVENIQKQNMKKSCRTLIDYILAEGKHTKEIKEIPRYKVKFAPLWSLTEEAQSTVDATRASTRKTDAETVISLAQGGMITPEEGRKMLVTNSAYDISPNMPKELKQAAQNPMADPNANPMGEDPMGQMETEPKETPLQDKPLEKITEQDSLFGEYDTQKVYHDSSMESEFTRSDSDLNHGVGVIILKDGKILCGVRGDGNGICGPGGHIQDDETPMDAAIRETKEEFGITPLNLKELGHLPKGNGYCDSYVFVTEEYEGEPKTDNDEMFCHQWLTPEELNEVTLFQPFKKSLDLLDKERTSK